MNLVEAFANYFETISNTTLGQDLYISKAPSSNKVTDRIWWVIGRGGAVTQTSVTSERTKERIIEVYYRDRDAKAVYNALEAVEEQLNCANCVELEGYDVGDVTCQILFVDNDLDLEDRVVGLLQVNITVYQEC